ncbi:MAG: RNA methyltransferase [Acidobacteriaceae bacterium]|nr:RNA methyltransferase [Acidobacteriaceae bacterium]
MDLSESLRIVLVAPRNPLNIGAAARAMSNFGFNRLRLVNPYEIAFKEARSAVRAQHVLEAAETFSTVAEAITDCVLVTGTTSVGHRDLHLPLYSLETAADLIQETGSCGAPVALLFGSEKFGLSNEDMSHCHWLLRIPTRKEHGSMNLGQAVAICLYELRRNETLRSYRFEESAPAKAEDYERLNGLLFDILNRSGYINEKTSQSTELKIRRLLRRSKIPSSDAETWLGMFRQIQWRLKQASSE